MSCTRPLYALDLGFKANGKRNIKLLPRRVDLSSIHQLEYRYGKGSILPLPCGKCLACRLAHAREWAVRCTLEASLYQDNSFITLTYDDDHLPEDKKLRKTDLQEFIKRLRYYAPGIRYFACGEYGSQFKRPHYHMIIFNYFPSDIRRGSSKLIEKLWPYGFNDVKELHFNRCQYVAKYTTKKIRDGNNDEFLIMSTKPGIGTGWLMKHFDIFEHDQIIGSFGGAPIPRYFEKLADAAFLDLSDLKDIRLSSANDRVLFEMLQHGLDKVEKLYEYKENIQVHDFAKRGELNG